MMNFERKKFRKTVALTLATTLATSSVAFANPASSYENTHRTLMQVFSAPYSIPVTIVIPSTATTANTNITTRFDIGVTPTRVASASIQDVTITGVSGSALSANTTITVDLVNATFDTDVAVNNTVNAGNWVTNLPRGAQVTGVTVDTTRTRATITIGADGLLAASHEEIAITIPTDALADDTGAITIPRSSNAMFSIGYRYDDLWLFHENSNRVFVVTDNAPLNGIVSAAGIAANVTNPTASEGTITYITNTSTGVNFRLSGIPALTQNVTSRDVTVTIPIPGSTARTLTITIVRNPGDIAAILRTTP